MKGNHFNLNQIVFPEAEGNQFVVLEVTNANLPPKLRFRLLLSLFSLAKRDLAHPKNRDLLFPLLEPR